MSNRLLPQLWAACRGGALLLDVTGSGSRASDPRVGDVVVDSPVDAAWIVLECVGPYGASALKAVE